jgi:hypothetical protein
MAKEAGFLSLSPQLKHSRRLIRNVVKSSFIILIQVAKENILGLFVVNFFVGAFISS